MPTIEERLGIIETQNTERLREEHLRRMEVDRRLGGIEGGLSLLTSNITTLTLSMHTLTETTKAHAFKATCINGGAKLLQGASATGGVTGGIIAAIWALKELGFL